MESFLKEVLLSVTLRDNGTRQVWKEIIVEHAPNRYNGDNGTRQVWKGIPAKCGTRPGVLRQWHQAGMETIKKALVAATSKATIAPLRFGNLTMDDCPRMVK